MKTDKKKSKNLVAANKQQQGAKGSNTNTIETQKAPTIQPVDTTVVTPPVATAPEKEEPKIEQLVPSVAREEAEVVENLMYYDMQNVVRDAKGISFTDSQNYGLQGFKRFIPVAEYPVYELWREYLNGAWYLLINLVVKYGSTDTKITPDLVESMCKLKPLKEVKQELRYSYGDLMNCFTPAERKWLQVACAEYIKTYSNGDLTLPNLFIDTDGIYKIGDTVVVSTGQESPMYAVVCSARKNSIVNVVDERGYTYAIVKGTKVVPISHKDLGEELCQHLLGFIITLQNDAAKAKNDVTKKQKREQERKDKHEAQKATELKVLADISADITKAKNREYLEGLKTRITQEVKLKVALKAEIAATKAQIDAEIAARFPSTVAEKKAKAEMEREKGLHAPAIPTNLKDMQALQAKVNANKTYKPTADEKKLLEKYATYTKAQAKYENDLKAQATAKADAEAKAAKGGAPVAPAKK